MVLVSYTARPGGLTCNDCGSVIGDVATHTQWHGRASRLETRGFVYGLWAQEEHQGDDQAGG